MHLNMHLRKYKYAFKYKHCIISVLTSSKDSSMRGI